MLFGLTGINAKEFPIVVDGLEGSAVLHQKCTAIEKFNDALKEKVANIKDTLSSCENGAGLAAPQVGYSDRIFAIKP